MCSHAQDQACQPKQEIVGQLQLIRMERHWMNDWPGSTQERLGGRRGSAATIVGITKPLNVLQVQNLPA